MSERMIRPIFLVSHFQFELLQVYNSWPTIEDRISNPIYREYWQNPQDWFDPYDPGSRPSPLPGPMPKEPKFKVRDETKRSC